jgi:cytochrome P450
MLFKVMRRNFGGRGPWSRFLRARERLDTFIYREIHARRENGIRGDDILSSMLDAAYDDGSRMTDQEIRDQLVTLVFAAHETTGVALAWAFYWLARHPDECRRLEEELASVAAESPYLEAVCQETLRLHPVIPEVIRKLLQPLEIQGFRIPAGTAVAACTSIVHERSELYPEPHRFKPERFLDRTFSPFEHFPFGGGSRRCIGAWFAVEQMKAVLAALLLAYRIELVRGDPEPCALRNLTVGPKRGVEVRATTR